MQLFPVGEHGARVALGCAATTEISDGEALGLAATSEPADSIADEVTILETMCTYS